MTITPEQLRWGSLDENDPITAAPNKVEPTSEFKNSGLKRDQLVPRAYLNYQFDKSHEFFLDLQAQIDALTISAGSGTLQAIFHVGALYYTTDSTLPNVRFGFGTWERIKGKFIVGLDEADNSFDGAGETGGSKTHSHSNTFNVGDTTLDESQMPLHNHPYQDSYLYEISGSLSSVPTSNKTLVGTINGGHGNGSRDSDNNTLVFRDHNTSSTGGGLPHGHGISGGVNSSSHIPPYFSAYIYRRIA